MVRDQACQLALKLALKSEHAGGGAPEVGDLRPREDGSERGSALGSDVVFGETAGEERRENGEREWCRVKGH